MRTPSTVLRSGTTAALGIMLLTVACDRESPTDVSVRPPSPAAVVGTPSLAVGGNKPIGGYEINTASSNVATGFLGVIEVYCSTGKRALGGGFKIGGGALINDTDVALYESTPRVTGGTDGWRVEAYNRTADTRAIEAWVICAPM